MAMSPRNFAAVVGTLLVLCFVTYARADGTNIQQKVVGPSAGVAADTTSPVRLGPALPAGQSVDLAQNQPQNESKEEKREERAHERKEKAAERRKVSAEDTKEVNRILWDARKKLEKMPPAYAGHRASAIKHVDEALYEVQQMYKVNP
jgi:hypothetical protein